MNLSVGVWPRLWPQRSRRCSASLFKTSQEPARLWGVLLTVPLWGLSREDTSIILSVDVWRASWMRKTPPTWWPTISSRARRLSHQSLGSWRATPRKDWARSKPPLRWRVHGTSSDNSSRRLVAVSPQQKSASAMRPSPNTSSDDKGEGPKTHRKCKLKMLQFDSSSNGSCECKKSWRQGGEGNLQVPWHGLRIQIRKSWLSPWIQQQLWYARRIWRKQKLTELQPFNDKCKAAMDYGT